MLLEDASTWANHDIELRTNYSGRGMYGKTTLGVVGSLAAIMDFMIGLGQEIGTSGIYINTPQFEVDNMGKDYIAYVTNLESDD